ncbi:C40 family peptidase [Rosenbergiella metrosideri]|uniref:C40 family peptidase n=2 Tax=Rosenbergiella TaxID=1356488 RepID=UPI001F4F49D0|nr:C40 family peptidase [Rosenbergiella metrosideri]
MREKLLEAIRQHVIAEYPKEACGVIIQKSNKQTYMPCHNDADDPLNTFVMRDSDYRSAEQEGEVIMIIHSHPDVPVLIPSEMDRIQCDYSGLEWGIMSWPDGDFCTFSPRTDRDYVGRPWVLGHADCWSLIMDYHKREYGIELRNWSVPYEWWASGKENRYEDNWRAEGFIEVQTPQPGDMIMMQIGAPVTNHAAIYLGDNLILHHNYGNLSTRVPYGQYFRDRTVRIVRHKDIPDAKNTHP